MRKNKIKLLQIMIITLFVNLGLFAELDRTVKVYKLKKEIKIDGILNESIWKNEPASNFIQLSPDEGKPATEKTNVWVAYDDMHIYIGAKLYDSKPNLIDQKLARRDARISSDQFYISFDSYNDNRTGFYFGVNPGGSIVDGTISNDGREDNSWNGIWEVETKIDKNGWNVEMKIPLSQLRYNQSEKMIWGVNFARDIFRKNESVFYLMVPKDESGFVSKFPDLIGLDGIQSKKRIEILPYIVGKAQYLEHDENDPFYSENQYKIRVGGDFKIGIGSNFTLDATVNPDFGQVEADPASINLSAFETYFREKRPFFIEGQNIFDFGNGGANNNWNFNFGTPNLIYSRRIGRRPQGIIDYSKNYNYDYIDTPTETRILSAGKLTGKTKNNLSVGILSAMTERTFATIIDTATDSTNKIIHKQQIEPLTHYGAFRSQKEFNDGRQSLGIIFTSVNRNLSDSLLNTQLSKDAYNFGIDGWTFLDKDKMWVLTGNVIGSFVSGSEEYMLDFQNSSIRYFQRPDANKFTVDSSLTSMSGWFSRVMLNKQNGNFYFNTAIGASSPGFSNNDLGFQYSTDKINGHVVFGYKQYEPGKIFRMKMMHFIYTELYDFEFNNLDRKFMTFDYLQFKNYYNLMINGGFFLEAYSKNLTRGGPLAKTPETFFGEISLSSDSRKKVVFDFGYEYWGQNKIDSYGSSYNFGIQWQPSSKINFEIGPSYSENFETIQWVGVFEDVLATETYGNRYVFAEMIQKTVASQIRMNWTFTPKLSLELFMQPYISVGKYDNFKELAKSRSYETNNYDDIGIVSYDENSMMYTIDPDGSGSANSFDVSNPNFNYKSFKANVVLRWEVAPGSVLYLVWTNNKSDYQTDGKLDMYNNSVDLWKVKPDNIFMMKFSYWFDVGGML
ncbi:MAG: DUF5916 domain-containing protein [Candidatus Marinimicrobia bacterium]|nr:DUF5916 domain-containing protein [Candidatus Neomarinimicrobiota bacterium]